MERNAITAAVAAGLVTEQFPQWADLPVVPVELNGWDNTTFRLGDAYSVRLPSHERCVPQVEKEHRWLPELAPELPLPIPEPIALGRPSRTFPRPWSIYRLIDGHRPRVHDIADLSAFARDLAGFLVALYAIDASHGPAPGAHSFGRGGPLDCYDADLRRALAILADEMDAVTANQVWEAALASACHGPPVWAYGDVAPSNLVVMNGQLAAVIDFGCSAVGDPACDLVVAWTFFFDESAEVFRSSLALDDETWSRGRGWALWKAVVNLAREKQGGPESNVAARRWGWHFTHARSSWPSSLTIAPQSEPHRAAQQVHVRGGCPPWRPRRVTGEGERGRLVAG
jgi:aminoglycoside phosphotransferase (APT) family kinase protein